jgi:hypothetical protein
MISISMILQSVPGLLPFVALGLTATAFSARSGYPFEGMIKGTLVWGWLLILATHILSLFGELSFYPLCLFWFFYIVVAIICCIKTRPMLPDRPIFSFPVIALLCTLLLTFVVALLYPPNTFDSMTYHMPKIANWLQNGSQNFYLTYIIRQNILTPGAETIIFHSFALARGDYFANLVQWGAFAGSICAVYSTACLLGAGKRGSLAASVFVATLPMGIAQATSTQTDMAVSFWLICLANRFLVWLKDKRSLHALFCGMALGLALVTKGTAYLFSLPFVLVFAFFAFYRFKKLFMQCALAAVIALPCFFPHIVRIYTTYGKLDVGLSSVKVSSPSPAGFAAIAGANIFVNIPKLPGGVNLAPLYAGFLQAIGVDEKARAFFPYGAVTKRKHYPIQHVHEDFVPNPLHLIAVLLALFLFVPRKAVDAVIYKRCVGMGVFLFCLLIPWQPWITRLQLPIFVLTAPLVGLQIERHCRAWWGVPAGIFLFMSIPALLWNISRPLLPSVIEPYIPSRNLWYKSERVERYFNNRHYLTANYIRAAEIIAARQPQRIFLFLNSDSWEYPLWVLLQAGMIDEAPRIEYLPVSALQDMYKGVYQSEAPELIFVLDRSMPWESKEDKTPRVFEYSDGKLKEFSMQEK